jgi:hypothetical protein
MPTILEPKKISDVVYRMDDYISFIRTLEEEQAEAFCYSLEEYILTYFFQEKIDVAVFKKQILEMTNSLYVQMMDFSVRDEYTHLYFDIVLRCLFQSAQEQGVSIFFILTNELSDDRFILVITLFQYMGFATITPYETKELESTPSYTNLHQRHYDAVEQSISYAVEDKKNILYLEKDTTVSYVHRILDEIENVDTTYQYLYRTKPSSNDQALWIRGKSKTIVHT